MINIESLHRFIVILLWIAVASFTTERHIDEVYYYYKSERIYLPIDPTVISVSMRGQHTLDELRAQLETGERLQYTSQNNIWASIENTDPDNNAIDSLYYTEIKFSRPLSQERRIEIKQRIEKIPSVQMVAPALLSNNGDPMGISNNFYVKLKQESDFGILVELAERSNIKIRGRDRYMPLWYVLSCDQNSNLNSIDAANYFYESGLFENTEPEFILHN